MKNFSSWIFYFINVAVYLLCTKNIFIMINEEELKEIEKRAKELYSYTESDWGDDDDDDASYRIDYKKYEGYVRGASEQIEKDNQKIKGYHRLWNDYSDWLHRTHFNMKYAEEFFKRHFNSTEAEKLIGEFKTYCNDMDKEMIEKENPFKK